MNTNTNFRRFYFGVLGVLIIFAGFVMTASADTLTLAEGVDGYSGCSDTFYGLGGTDSRRAHNYGEAPQLLINVQDYKSD